MANKHQKVAYYPGCALEGSGHAYNSSTKALGKALETNTTLTSLHLWNNKLGEAGGVALGKALPPPMPDTAEGVLPCPPLENRLISAYMRSACPCLT